MKYFSMPGNNEETMSFGTLLNDASGRVMLAGAGLFVLAGGIARVLAPSLLAYPVLAAGSSLAVIVGSVGFIRAVYVAPEWALASIFTASYPLPLFHFFELMAIKNCWPVGYVLFPAGMILLLFSATGEIPMLRAHATPRNQERLHTAA